MIKQLRLFPNGKITVDMIDPKTGNIVDPDFRPGIQKQTSVNDQLREVVDICNRMGYYDAADFITNHLNRNV